MITSNKIGKQEFMVRIIGPDVYSAITVKQGVIIKTPKELNWAKGHRFLWFAQHTAKENWKLRAAPYGEKC